MVFMPVVLGFILDFIGVTRTLRGNRPDVLHIDFVSGFLKIVVRLQAHPELFRRTERTCKP